MSQNLEIRQEATDGYRMRPLDNGVGAKGCALTNESKTGVETVHYLLVDKGKDGHFSPEDLNQLARRQYLYRTIAGWLNAGWNLMDLFDEIEDIATLTRPVDTAPMSPPAKGYTLTRITYNHQGEPVFDYASEEDTRGIRWEPDLIITSFPTVDDTPPPTILEHIGEDDDAA